MKKEFDVVVVGAGMVGLVTAALLAQTPSRDRLKITLVDAGKKPLFDADNDIALRVSAVSRGSMNILQELGVWEKIVSLRACPYRSMRVWDSRESIEGPNTLRFDAVRGAALSGDCDNSGGKRGGADKSDAPDSK